MRDEAFDAEGVGRAVRARRKERGWTQADLARWVGVSRPTIVSFERGGPVSLPVAMRALAMLGAKVVIVPKGSLIRDEGTPDA